MARTSAVPTTAPSDLAARARALSRESIPKPTTTGSPSSPRSAAARGPRLDRVDRAGPRHAGDRNVVDERHAALRPPPRQPLPHGPRAARGREQRNELRRRGRALRPSAARPPRSAGRPRAARPRLPPPLRRATRSWPRTKSGIVVPEEHDPRVRVGLAHGPGSAERGREPSTRGDCSLARTGDRRPVGRRIAERDPQLHHVGPPPARTPGPARCSRRRSDRPRRGRRRGPCAARKPPRAASREPLEERWRDPCRPDRTTRGRWSRPVRACRRAPARRRARARTRAPSRAPPGSLRSAPRKADGRERLVVGRRDVGGDRPMSWSQECSGTDARVVEPRADRVGLLDLPPVVAQDVALGLRGAHRRGRLRASQAWRPVVTPEPAAFHAPTSATCSVPHEAPEQADRVRAAADARDGGGREARPAVPGTGRGPPLRSRTAASRRARGTDAALRRCRCSSASCARS